MLVHPKYDLTHGRWKYNVALYKTQEPIKFNKKIQPVEIGTENLKVDTKGTVLGWGDKGEVSYVGLNCGFSSKISMGSFVVKLL